MIRNENNEIKFGALISYLLIIINAIYGLTITPYIINKIGISDYGVYKTIVSFSAAISIMDLGIGGTVQRYIAKFKTKDDKRKIGNFSAMSFIEAIVICILIALVSIILYQLIQPAYQNSFNLIEIIKAKQLFIMLIITMCFHIFENLLVGIISGYNRFIFSNSINLLRIILRIISIYVLLNFFNSSITLVAIDLILTIIAIIVHLVYINNILQIKIKLYYWDKTIFKESFIYTIFLFIQSIVVQVNGNLDNVVVGAIIGSKAVAVYSIGLLVFNMFQQLSTTISGVMLPTVIRITEANDDIIELENLVIKVGRIQFALLGAALAAFAIIGKEFILLWLGIEYLDAWIITIILMVPALIELSQNICLAILRAKNKLKFRTIVLVISTIINFIITILGTRKYGYFAAAAGTAVSIILGSLVIMNVYYYKILKLNIFHIFKEIFNRTSLCLVIASLILIFFNKLIGYGGWFYFFIKALVFSITYSILMLSYGFDKNERIFFIGSNKENKISAR